MSTQNFPTSTAPTHSNAKVAGLADTAQEAADWILSPLKEIFGNELKKHFYEKFFPETTFNSSIKAVLDLLPSKQKELAKDTLIDVVRSNGMKFEYPDGKKFDIHSPQGAAAAFKHSNFLKHKGLKEFISILKSPEVQETVKVKKGYEGLKDLNEFVSRLEHSLSHFERGIIKQVPDFISQTTLERNQSQEIAQGSNSDLSLSSEQQDSIVAADTLRIIEEGKDPVELMNEYEKEYGSVEAANLLEKIGVLLEQAAQIESQQSPLVQPDQVVA